MIFKDSSCIPSIETIKNLPGLVIFEEPKVEG